MPARAAACLTMACVFWRRRIDRCLEQELEPLALARADAVGAPLPPGRLERLVGAIDAVLPAGVRGPEARRCIEEVRGGLAAAPVDLLLDPRAVDEETEGGTHRGIREQRMAGLGARALAVDLAPRIREIEAEVLRRARRTDEHAALAALLEPHQDVVLHLHVPGEVVFTGLQHGPRRGDGVAAPFHLDAVEERAVRHVVAGMKLRADRVARLEIDEPIRSGAHRLDIGGRLPRPGAPIGAEDVPGNHHAARATEGLRPERIRLLEHDFHRVLPDLLNALEIAIDPERRRRRGGVGRVFPGEDQVGGGERRAVVPAHSLLEGPGHRGAVPGDAAVLGARDLGRQHRHELPFRVEVGEGLVEDPRSGHVLHAHGEVGIEDGRRLPVQQSQRARLRPAASAGTPTRRPAPARAWRGGGGPQEER